MSVDKAFREMIREEIAVQLRALQKSFDRFEAGASEIERLRGLAERLSPLASLFGTGARRGPGRPPGAVRALPSGTRRRGRPPKTDVRPCAIVGCKNPSRTKGYCAAHYQKLRMLIRTNRRPADWKDYAEPHTVPDLVLPRGRAASKKRKDASGS